MWVDTRDDENDNKPRKSAFADKAMHTALNEELAKKGWRETSNNPDVLVSYDILVERSIDQRQEPVYTRPMTRVYYNPYFRRYGTIYYPSQFVGYETYQEPVRDGTVTITIMDANTDKPVWQGWTTERLDHVKITDKEISRSVKNIMKKFNTGS